MDKYVAWVSNYLKLYKAIFHKYSAMNISRSITRKAITFDDMNSQKSVLGTPEVYNFLSAFKITSCFPHIKREDIKRVIKLINLQGNEINQSTLSLIGFIEFVLNIGRLAYPEIDKASIFMPLLFSHMKDVSLSSKQPLFQRLFEDPQASTIGDPKLISALTLQVNRNPNF